MSTGLVVALSCLSAALELAGIWLGIREVRRAITRAESRGPLTYNQLRTLNEDQVADLREARRAGSVTVGLLVAGVLVGLVANIGGATQG